MSQILEQQLSAFLDGELPAEELDLLLARLDREPAQRATLARYAMIGECLRSGAASPAASASRSECVPRCSRDWTPAVAWPRRAPADWRGWLAGGVAAAATVAAVLVAGPGYVGSRAG